MEKGEGRGRADLMSLRRHFMEHGNPEPELTFTRREIIL
jgi:hypothetical protein